MTYESSGGSDGATTNPAHQGLSGVSPSAETLAFAGNPEASVPPLPTLISAFERHYGMSRSEMSDAARMAGDHLKVALLPLKSTDTHGSPSLRKHATEAIDAFAAARATTIKGADL